MVAIAQVNGHTVLEVEPNGPLLGSERDATDLLSEAFSADATIIVLPVERLDPQFLQLRSGLAGAFIQNLQNYERRLFIVGDISAAIEASAALRDFVYETNKVGRHRFIADRAALTTALS